MPDRHDPLKSNIEKPNCTVCKAFFSGFSFIYMPDRHDPLKTNIEMPNYTMSKAFFLDLPS